MVVSIGTDEEGKDGTWTHRERTAGRSGRARTRRGLETNASFGGDGQPARSVLLSTVVAMPY